MELRRDNPLAKPAIALTAILASTPCFAHGEQALVLPFSNAVALVCFVVFLALWRQPALFKVLAFGLLALGIALSWVLPLLPHTIGELAGYSFGYIFAVGFGVPIVMAVLGCVAIRLARRERKPDA
jgi:hypothetical protein